MAFPSKQSRGALTQFSQDPKPPLSRRTSQHLHPESRDESEARGFLSFLFAVSHDEEHSVCMHIWDRVHWQNVYTCMYIPYTVSLVSKPFEGFKYLLLFLNEYLNVRWPNLSAAFPTAWRSQELPAHRVKGLCLPFSVYAKMSCDRLANASITWWL